MASPVTLPQLANAVFVRDPDPQKLAALKQKLSSDQRFEIVVSPHLEWLAATVALPDSPNIPDAARASGLVFFEGWDTLAEGIDAELRCRQIAELAQRKPESLDQLPGDFGFAHFSEEGAATFVRSCGGLVPVYWCEMGERQIVTTILGDIPKYSGLQFEPDLLVYGIWSAGWGLFPDRRSPLRGVQVLAPGTAVVLGKHSPKMIRYWRPRVDTLPWPKPDQLDKQAVELRTLLIRYLDKHLHPQGGNLLTLSGGVDSTSLAAVAVRKLNRNISTWSLLPPEGPLLDHELSFIDPLLQELGIRQSLRVTFQQNTIQRLISESPANVFPIIHPALCDLPRIHREAPVKVLFGGEFADEVCGSRLTYLDWASHVSLPRLLTRLHRLPLGPLDIVKYGRYRLQTVLGKPIVPYLSKLPAFVPSAVQEEFGDWYGRQQQEAAADSLPRAGLFRYMEGDFAAMNWEGTSPLGIRRAFPFYHREVLELALRSHPADLIGPGTKRLLRRALRGIAPDRNLDRHDKGAWGNRALGSQKIVFSDSLPDDFIEFLDRDWFSNRFPEMTYTEGALLKRYVKFVSSAI